VYGCAVSLYFLSLDRKKVAKKDQGKPDCSARFALQTPHISLQKKLFDLNKDEYKCEQKIRHQGFLAEVTAVQQPNQCVCTDVLYPHPCLIFSLFLSFVLRQKKERLSFKKRTRKRISYLREKK